MGRAVDFNSSALFILYRKCLTVSYKERVIEIFYFISDTHFGHENVIRFCDRPFKNAQEMNAALINNWNSRVKEHDTVYILGDMFFRCDKPEEILKQLKGKKHLVIGNHDSSWMNKVDMNKYFLSVSNMLEINDGKRNITLCHYPMLTWKHAMRSYMIHGHIHNNTNADFFPLLIERDNVLNASVEINGYMPVTFEELLGNNRQFKNRFKTCDAVYMGE